MKKYLYLILAVSVIFTSCKKEEGCSDELATNYNVDAEKDDGSCIFSVAGGTWTTQSVVSTGNMTVSMAGLTVLDSAINYTETNPDSLEPYMLIINENGTYMEHDQANVMIEQGTWSSSGNQLTINSSDTTYILTVNSVSKNNLSMSITFNESETEMGMTMSFNLTQTINATREW